MSGTNWIATVLLVGLFVAFLGRSFIVAPISEVEVASYGTWAFPLLGALVLSLTAAALLPSAKITNREDIYFALTLGSVCLFGALVCLGVLGWVLITGYKISPV